MFNGDCNSTDFETLVIQHCVQAKNLHMTNSKVETLENEILALRDGTEDVKDFKKLVFAVSMPLKNNLLRLFRTEDILYVSINYTEHYCAH